MEQRDAKKQNSFKNILHLTIIGFIIILGISRFVFNQQKIVSNEIEEDSLPTSADNPTYSFNSHEKYDRQNDILLGTKYKDLTDFLYDIKRRLDRLTNGEDMDFEVYHKNFGIETNKFAKHFAAINQDQEIVDKLDEIAFKSQNILYEDDRDMRVKWLENMKPLVGNLIGLTDPTVETIYEQYYMDHIRELESLESWLLFIKDTLHKKNYKDIEHNYELHLAVAIDISTIDFARHSNNPIIWDKLEGITNIAKKMIDEEQKEKRMELIPQLKDSIDWLSNYIQTNQDTIGNVYIDDEEVVKNQLKCNDVTGKEIPSHLIDICHFYDQLPPLTNEQKELFRYSESYFVARYAFNNDDPIGGEVVKDYGEYILHNYLSWRAEGRVNARGQSRRLRELHNFDEFFKYDGGGIIPLYGYSVNESLRGSFEYELQLVTRMKNLNLAEPFNQWSDETAAIFKEGLQLLDEDNEIEGYLKYIEGLKRIHDMYITIPMHDVFTEQD